MWAGTLVAPFVTQIAQDVGAFPEGVSGMISQTTTEGPMEKFLEYLVGRATSGDILFVFFNGLALTLYLVLFLWYRREMHKRNERYAHEGMCKRSKLVTGTPSSLENNTA